MAKSETRGYVVVASRERFFYLSALNLMHLHTRL